MQLHLYPILYADFASELQPLPFLFILSNCPTQTTANRNKMLPQREAKDPQLFSIIVT